MQNSRICATRLLLFFATFGVAFAHGQTLVPDLSKPAPNLQGCLASSEKQKAANDAATSARYASSAGTLRAKDRSESTSSAFSDANRVNQALKDARDADCNANQKRWEEAKERSVNVIITQMQSRMDKIIAASKPSKYTSGGYSTYWMYCMTSWSPHNDFSDDNQWFSAVFPILVNREGERIVSIDENNPPASAVMKAFNDFVLHTYSPPFVGGACSAGYADKAAAEQAQSDRIHNPRLSLHSLTMTEWKWSGDRLTLPDQ